MSKPINDFSYYDMCNLQHFVNKTLLSKEMVDFRYLKNIVDIDTSLFNWKGIENIIDPDYLEILICFNNCLCFYKSPSLGIVIGKYVINQLDMNNLPSTVDIYSISGAEIGLNIPFKDIVLIKDNKFDIPPFITMLEWIKYINKIETTLDANLTVARLPATFVGDKKLITSFNSLIEKAIGGKPFAVGTADLKGKFEQFNIDFPIDPESLVELYKNYVNFAIQSIGIAGTNTQKRERLLVGEVQSQSEYSDLIYQEKLNCRNRIVEDSKTKLGIDISYVESKKLVTERKIKELSEQQRLAMGNIKGSDNNDDKGNDRDIEKK